MIMNRTITAHSTLRSIQRFTPHSIWSLRANRTGAPARRPAPGAGDRERRHRGGSGRSPPAWLLPWARRCERRLFRQDLLQQVLGLELGGEFPLHLGRLGAGLA